MIPTHDHFQNFVRYRKANLGYESCDYERTCWDFYSSKTDAQWITTISASVRIRLWMDTPLGFLS